MKITLKKALAIAKANGYEGEATVEAVTKFLADENISLVDASGQPVQITKGITLAISQNDGPADSVEVIDANAGEGDPDEAELDDEDDDEDEKSLRRPQGRRQAAQKARAASGFYAAGKAPSSPNSPIHRTVKRYDERRALRLAQGVKSVFADGESAVRFGALCRAQISRTGGIDYTGKSLDRDFLGKSGMSTIDNARGGSLVAVEEFRPELIDLLNDHGAARQLVNFLPSSGSTISFPRHNADPEAYWETEPSSGPTSEALSDRVYLTPKKLMAKAYISNELMNDSVVNFAEYLATKATRKMAQKEDNAFFNGNGEGTNGNIVGLANFLDSTIAIIDGAGAAWANITDANINTMMAALLSKAVTGGQAKWTMTSGAHFGVFNRLSRGLGGTGYAEGSTAGPFAQAFGFPIVYNNSTQPISASAKIFAYFGDFNMAAKACEVTGSFEIAFDESNRFDTDETVFRIKERIDINIHDGGDNATGTQSPVVAIKTT